MSGNAGKSADDMKRAMPPSLPRAGKRRNDLWVGLAFLAPNILGFCAFTLIPLVMSFGMAFTDWDILRHNLFRHEPLKFVGVENFSRLLHDTQFYRDLANTFFLMLGLPFAIAGSLAAALLLTRVNARKIDVRRALIVAVIVLVLSLLVLLRGGMPGGAVGTLFVLLGLGVFAMGVATSGTAYRTLFYLPHFTAGVATYVLWKKLYNPHTGPVNMALAPVLEQLSSWITAAPSAFARGVPVASAALILLLVAWQVRRLWRHWEDGDSGRVAIAAGTLGVTGPFGLWLAWSGASTAMAWIAPVAGAAVLALALTARRRRWGMPVSADKGFGNEIALTLVLSPLLVLLVAGLALGAKLPLAAHGGFHPPEWLVDYDWAKPALMIMALWAAIGSSNMILYLAGLSNIPPELYEAADMDGASASQRFWNITWPQLAPITFFIAVMSVIGGLQGGFEMARTMTAGGPAGATTTLSYFIFIEGFETGRLGYASAIAWILFALVFALSLVNFRFGNRNTND